MGRFEAEWRESVTQHYLDHRFDLLGSGWVRVRHGMECRGVEGIQYPAGGLIPDRRGEWLCGVINRVNLAEATRIWNLIEGDYRPIDWQLDFKSGFRWSERTWHLDIAYGHRPGADIKVPWELARMQHLPALALAFGFSRDEQTRFAAPEQYQREFHNQIVDFIATNPPRFGVNWSCTMEVAIRAVNWLIAFDLFRSFGAVFDETFERVFASSVMAHGRHIAGNLEWSPRWRGNHYLANVAGLLFIAGYLEQSVETDAWLAFTLSELIGEVSEQFGDDGANLEGSTCYHRLTAEMVAYATAFALGLSASRRVALRHHAHRPRMANLSRGRVSAFYETGADATSPCFPMWYIARLSRMAQFTRDMTKPNGAVAQVGDNDSGRFLKVHPAFSAMTVGEARARFANLEGYRELPCSETHWQENHLDHRALVDEIGALFAPASNHRSPRCRFADAAIVEALANGVRFACGEPGSAPAEDTPVTHREVWKNARVAIANLAPDRRREIEIELPGEDLRVGLELSAYPDFGVYLFRSKRLWLTVRCGPVGQNGVGGHSHNDQLSIELTIDGQDWTRDPGSYLYTALPPRRNQYRSAAAHYAPRVGEREPARLDTGLFRLGNARSGECLYFARDGFVGRHDGFGVPLYRVLVLGANRLTLADFKGALSSDALLPPALNIQLPVAFSPGYGIRLGSNE